MPTTPDPIQAAILDRLANIETMLDLALGRQLPPVVTPAPAPTPTPAPTLVATPHTPGFLGYDATTQAWQTGTFGNDRLAQFFSGNVNDDPIPAGLASLTSGSELVFTFKPGQAPTAFEVYDGGGRAIDNGTAPLQLFTQTGTAARLPLNHADGVTGNIFDGNGYNVWQSYPLPAGANEQTRVIVVVPGTRALFFRQIRFPGADASYLPAPVARTAKLSDKNGINAYWFTTYDPASVHAAAPTANLQQLRQYAAWRYYVPAQDIIDPAGKLRFWSAQSGGAHYIDMAKLAVQEGRGFLYSLMGNSPANIASFSAAQGTAALGGQDWHDVGTNAMWAYGADLLNPETYRWLGEYAWQVGALFGANTYPAAQLTQATTPINSYDPTPVVQSGLNLLGPGKGTIQVGNELAKNWKTSLAYLPPAAAAVLYAVFLDGYNNTMGAHIGIRNADPAINPLIGMLYAADAGYLHAFGDKLGAIYGFNLDGSVKNMPAQVDFHEYARNPQTGAGVPFEQSPLPGKITSLTTVLNKLNPQASLLLSEWGYAGHAEATGFADDGSQHAGYSYLPAGTLPAPQRRAAVTASMAVRLAVLGVGAAYLYDDADHVAPAAGVNWDLLCGTNNTPTQAQLAQLAALGAGYAYASSTEAAGVLHAVFTKAGAPDLHAVLGSGAYALPLNRTATVTAYTLLDTGTAAQAGPPASLTQLTGTAGEAPALFLVA